MSIEDLMKELKQEYVSSIPEKIQEIKNQLASKDLIGLQNSFHKLKGSGKTYGIPEITILGECFEKLIQQHSYDIINLIPKSIHLFEKIYHQRKNNQEYLILEDLDYKQLPK